MNTSSACGSLAPLQQQWPLPTKPRPIVVIGAGGVVNDAHLPAYRAAGLPVCGVFDVQQERSRQTAARFDIPRVYDSLTEAAGEPQGVFARSIGHPRLPEFASTRTSAILDYGEQTRCCLSLNNTWNFGPQRERAEIRLEGANGAAIVEIGSLLNYPAGAPDALHYITTGQEWRSVPLVGNWFPDAFSGTMSNLQRFANGEDACLSTKVEDALKTMALIEALYESNASGATRIESAP